MSISQKPNYLNLEAWPILANNALLKKKAYEEKVQIHALNLQKKNSKILEESNSKVVNINNY